MYFKMCPHRDRLMEEDSDVGVTVMEIYNEKIKDLLSKVTCTSDKHET